MSFKTSECAWAQTSLKLLGRTVVGIKGFEFKKSVEKEHIYAAGADPIDIQSGNIKPEGSLKLLKFEVDQLNQAAQAAGFSDITEVPHDAILITCQFKRDPTAVTKTVVASGVSFTEMGLAMEQGAKMMEVSLPFICMKVTVS